MKRATAAIAVLAALTFAAPAHAGWKIDRALKIAQIVWNPDCGQLRVQYGSAEAAGTVAEAGAWAWAGNCTIGLNAAVHDQSFEPLCQKILHEGGHVDGLGHSANQASVMRASFMALETTAIISGREVTRWDGIDSRCLNRGRPFLRAHSAL